MRTTAAGGSSAETWTSAGLALVFTVALKLPPVYISDIFNDSLQALKLKQIQF
jgi:hypothetical protein